MTTLIVSNDEMKDITEIVKYLKESHLLYKGVSITMEKEAANKKDGFPDMLMVTLGANLWRNISRAKRGIPVSKGIIRAVQDF